MGAASTILLKNLENILPLRTSGIKKIAVIGSDATTNQLYGIFSFAIYIHN